MEKAVELIQGSSNNIFRRSTALDGIRGIAVLLVIAFHMDSPGKLSALPAGFLGVDIFFVLSGFLITSVLFREYDATGKVSLRNFYIRRALRLLPALVVFLFATTLYAFFAAPTEEANKLLNAVPAALFYYANWMVIKGVSLSFLTHIWSLAVEEQFYLFWPPLLIFLLRRQISSKALGTFMISAIVVSAGLKAYFFYTTGFYVRAYSGTDCRVDELILGALTALFLREGVASRAPRSLAALAACSVVPFITLSQHPDAFLYYGGSTLFSILVALFIFVVASHTACWDSTLGCKPLAFVGQISYGLYLWHLPSSVLVRKYGQLSALGYQLVYPLVALGLASLSFLLIEKRFLKFKSRFAAP